MLNISIISIFPELFNNFMEYGILSNAFKQKISQMNFFNPRDFTNDRYRKIDDTAFGTGIGMVLKIEPLEKAFLKAKEQINSADIFSISFSPHGRQLTENLINELVIHKNIILTCGRYKGIDERYLNKYVDLQISIGDYVVSGGELPAMVFLDALLRKISWDFANKESVTSDSFNDGLLDAPQYTRPFDYNGDKVPDVLLSGNHQAINLWQLKMRLFYTYRYRPDLIKLKKLTQLERQLLDQALVENNLLGNKQ